MNRRFIDILFALLVFSLPFNFMPQMLWQQFLGGPFGASLVVYPLIIGFAYTAYCQWKYKNVFYKFRVFKKFAFIYLVILLVSLVWGLYNYPYYTQILNGPADQIEKLPGVLSFLHGMGIPIKHQTLLEFWMLARLIKGVLFELLYTFGAVYMIFSWYHDRAQRAVDILLKVTVLDLVIIAAYGLVDVCYQNGQMWAQNALMTMNSIIHANMGMQTDPTIPQVQFFRDAQNRSIFTEPSAYGIFMAFAYPLLWWIIFRTQNIKTKILLWVLFLVITFEVFLSQSRLALAVSFAVFGSFTIFSLYSFKKEFITLLLTLLIGGGIAFSGAICFLQHGQVPARMGDWYPLATKWQEMQKQDAGKIQLEKDTKNVNADVYFEEGLASLSNDYKEGQHAGSNHSRFTVQKTHIQLGLEHPLLGVGTSLRQGYLRDKLDKDPGGEIQTWNKATDQKGLLRGNIPNLGEFTCRFAETGMLGLLCYLFPAFILLWRYAKVILQRERTITEISPFVFSGLSFVGIMATGLGDWMNVFFCYWMAMAIGYLVTGEKVRNLK